MGNQPGGPRRVLVADDAADVRLALKAALSREPDLELVAEAATGADAVGACEPGTLDVAVVDGGMPGGGPELVRQLCARHPGLRVVVWSGSDATAIQRENVEAGAAAYVVKGARLSELVAAVRG
jgi:DNA-binding NarL/FixJ family response regulator